MPEVPLVWCSQHRESGHSPGLQRGRGFLPQTQLRSAKFSLIKREPGVGAWGSCTKPSGGGGSCLNPELLLAQAEEKRDRDCESPGNFVLRSCRGKGAVAFFLFIIFWGISSLVAKSGT